ncbi:DUF6268 family outer membrane beta-barrel protein [Bacteroides reticulotermitis]|uniref:DUF6268 domain-containing protein n=2 Tax=Bacteroides reticulotermitis TaxID=1133319 RepID=W4UXN7_9BACE|nr:DUF6268 family outer membrane beta-barrel protein [Bacteroides reticulotermitis]MBB4042761.1 hypothetical protein [Bacteroides reticulotermitis]GAE85269.1 hypothetical protein JCM10512_3686 [Bacteroides reticulotermitis JCM 10512]
MKKITFLLIIVWMSQASTLIAQVSKPDTLVQEIRSYVARNFSQARTFNLYWETGPSHDYTLKRNGQEIENGKMRDMHTIKFSVNVPILLLKNFSLYTNGQANFYKFEARNNATGEISSLYSENEGAYNYYKGGLSATYRTKIAGKPLILNANISGDGWNEGFEKIEGSFSAIVMLKNTSTSRFSIGLYGMTLYNQVPALPIISYWHQFNPQLSVDITLPSQVHLRYQFNSNHRLSLGAQMESERFYIKPAIEDLSQTYLHSTATIKPEIVYEFIINKHFYLIARGGGSALLQSGLYKTNRKGIDGDPLVEFNRSIQPFFNLGFSYNLFK